MNTTELIILSVTNGGHSIEFLPTQDGKTSVSIDGHPIHLVFCDFVQLSELFIANYLNLGIESEKRIDGGCVDVWHGCKVKLDDCPTCGEKSDQCNSPWHVLPTDAKVTDCPLCGAPPGSHVEPIEPWPRG